MSDYMLKKNMYIYKLITREMRGMGGVLPELCAVASPLGTTTASPSGSSSAMSPQSPLALPTWQILIHSKWENKTESKTRVAKYKQLCEMEPLCIILRWCTLFLKTPMIAR